MALDLEMDSDEHVRHLLVGREEWESIRVCNCLIEVGGALC